jgi:hypothetical protein
VSFDFPKEKKLLFAGGLAVSDDDEAGDPMPRGLAGVWALVTLFVFVAFGGTTTTLS